MMMSSVYQTSHLATHMNDRTFEQEVLRYTYYNKCGTLNIDTPHYHFSAINSTAHTGSLTEIGDISLSKCKISNGKEIVFAAISMSPNH